MRAKTIEPPELLLPTAGIKRRSSSAATTLRSIGISIGIACSWFAIAAVSVAAQSGTFGDQLLRTRPTGLALFQCLGRLLARLEDFGIDVAFD